MRSVLDCHAGKQGSLPAGDKVPSSRSTYRRRHYRISRSIVAPPSGNPVNHCTLAVALQWSSCEQIPREAGRKRKK